MGLYWDSLGSLDAKSNPIPANLQDRDLDFISDDDLLFLLSTNDQHSDLPPHKKCSHTSREIQMAKKYIEFWREMCIGLKPLLFSVPFCQNERAFEAKRKRDSAQTQDAKRKRDSAQTQKMMKYLLSTTCLTLLLFGSIQAQDVRPGSGASNTDARTAAEERLLTIAGTNYVNQLALRGFNLESQGVLIESLDGRSVFADLNSNVGFNPASVIKVATSFAALSKFGPEYHFETGFYADGAINKKTHTLEGNLVLASAGDPMLNAIDVARLVRDVVRAGIMRVEGDLVVTGPFTYGMYSTTDRATKALAQTLRRTGIHLGNVINGGALRGTKLTSHVSESLRDILFYQNCHSINWIAERVGEAVGGPKGVEAFLVRDVGITQGDVYISRTSGLDFNRITPRATVQLFRELVFWLNLNNLQPQDLLPVAGVDAGTLARRFAGEEFRGAVIGKTGTLPGTDGGVSTLAGIAYTRNRGPVLFAIFNTQGSVATYRKLQDNFLKGFILESGGLPEVNASLHRLNN
jgi:D-alanyl-D-alanine carboxypeptidase/D-alanyl-D-alanine-endopeptidase (penicillin-binding protein 4)